MKQLDENKKVEWDENSKPEWDEDNFPYSLRLCLSIIFFLIAVAFFIWVFTTTASAQGLNNLHKHKSVRFDTTQTNFHRPIWIVYTDTTNEDSISGIEWDYNVSEKYPTKIIYHGKIVATGNQFTFSVSDQQAAMYAMIEVLMNQPKYKYQRRKIK